MADTAPHNVDPELVRLMTDFLKELHRTNEEHRRLGHDLVRELLRGPRAVQDSPVGAGSFSRHA